jgi:dTMP kinase
MFIAIEGCDGAGKSTAIKHVENQLILNGYKVVVTREPGGTKVAEQLRGILLSVSEEEPIDPIAELYLMMAARRQHINTKIKPLIAQGHIVLSDRFVDSGYAYQACGRNIHEQFEIIEKMTLEGFSEDMVLYFDVSFETSRERVLGRFGKQDRLDMEEEAFHKRVYDGYQYRMELKKHKVVKIQAEGKPEVVAELARDFVNKYFPLKTNKEES